MQYIYCRANYTSDQRPDLGPFGIRLRYAVLGRFISDTLLSHADVVAAGINIQYVTSLRIGGDGGQPVYQDVYDAVFPDGYLAGVGWAPNGGYNSVTILANVRTDASGKVTSFFPALIGTEYDLPQGGPPDSPSPPVAGASLALDEHRRPLAVLAGGTSAAPALTGAYSKDGGHSFTTASLNAGSDPSLLVDTRRNTYRLVYAGPGLQTAWGSLGDGYVADPASPQAITGLAGNSPAAAQHPSDRDYALLAYLDGTTLKTAFSNDGGANWQPLATVAAGLDFTSSGRPAVCWLGETAYLAYSAGAALVVRSSADRGLTWGNPITVATAPANPDITAPAYSGLSLLGWQGRLFLLAWGFGATGTTPAPALWISPTLGATWAAAPGALPAGLAPPTALGVVPQIAQLRLGISFVSNNDGLIWGAA